MLLESRDWFGFRKLRKSEKSKTRNFEGSFHMDEMEKLSLEKEMDDGCIVVGNRTRQINGGQVKVLDDTSEIPYNYKLLMDRKVAIFKDGWRDTRFDNIRNQVDFRMADDNLTVFLNTTVNGETYGSILVNEFRKLDKSGIQCKKEMTLYYCFDRLTYLCTVDSSTFPCNGAFKAALNTRLSSDAFLQPPVRNLTNLQENTKPAHYRSDGWLVLSSVKVSCSNCACARGSWEQ